LAHGYVPTPRLLHRHAQLWRLFQCFLESFAISREDAIDIRRR
jgi:hypothetical protein